MPGRIYSVQFAAVAITAAQDLFEINAPADASVELLEVHLGQTTELADAAEEQLRLSIKTGATSSGSGGTTPTAIPRQLGDSAFGGTVEVNNTTQASGGTIVVHESHIWNVRGPFMRIWTPETTIIINPSTRLTVELLAAPADSVTASGFALFREIGG